MRRAGQYLVGRPPWAAAGPLAGFRLGKTSSFLPISSRPGGRLRATAPAPRFLIVAALLAALPAFPQRAQYPTKGRSFDRSRPRVLESIRRLPRRQGEPVPAPSPLEDFLARQRAAEGPARSLPEDRLRALVRPVPPAAPPAPRAIAPERPYDVLPLPSYEPVLLATPLPPPRTGDAVPNRWRLGFPSWQRYDNRKLDAVYARSRWWDPFNRNTAKGDYPLFGRRNFLNFTASSETLAETRRVPVPSVQSADRPGDFGFFGRGDQVAVRQSFRLSFDLFRGSAGFRPVDYELRVTPEFNINYLRVRENGLTRIDVRERATRTDTNIGLQELFVEKRLFTNSAAAFRPRRDGDDHGSAYFDFTSLRAGIQRFTSDFRGFVFSDEQPGVRLFGTFRNNIYQYNLAYFSLLEKDTNSGLNRWRRRNQTVYAANLYWNDFLTPGYNLNFSLLYNNDQPSFHIDKNGFLVRPAPIGLPLPHKIRAAYAGLSGDGHIGRINVSHAFYQAFGRDDFHPLPAQKNPQHINAQLAALELAYEKDWKTYRVSAFFTSGDNDLNDGRARGFDAIVPNQQFAGGGFLGDRALADRGLINNAFEGGGTNFLNRQAIPLTGTGLLLFGPNSLIPNLRGGLFQGQANFINPGVLLFNAGMDARLTPKLRSTVNVNYARFHRTEVLEAVLFQSGIRHGIGVDTGLGLQYRPLLSENIAITGGFGVLFPQDGFQHLYNGRTLYSGFVNMRLVY